MSIIIKTPQPDTEERLVLVSHGDGKRTTERDATPADLARGGYVPSVGYLPRREVETAVSDAMDLQRRLDRMTEVVEQNLERAEAAEGLLVQRETELRLAREDGAAVERQMREARSAADASFVRANRAEMRAEKAERALRCQCSEPGDSPCRVHDEERADAAERRAEKAEATLAMHGRPTYVEAVARAEKAERGASTLAAALETERGLTEKQRARAETAERELAEVRELQRSDERDGNVGFSLTCWVESILDQLNVARINRTELGKAAGQYARERDEHRDRAARAERERDEAKAGHNALEAELADVKAECAGAMLSAHAQYAEAERDTLRAELARLTAPGEGSEGEPTDEELLATANAAWAANMSTAADARRALFRAGVAHKQQPAKDRATDEELFGIADGIADGLRAIILAVAARVRQERCLVAQAVGMGASLDEELFGAYQRAFVLAADEEDDIEEEPDPERLKVERVTPEERAGILAVAARVRQERCLVAQAVARGWYIYLCPQKNDPSKWDIETGRVIAGRSDGGAILHGVPAADVPATLARLLGEVSRG